MTNKIAYLCISYMYKHTFISTYFSLYIFIHLQNEKENVKLAFILQQISFSFVISRH